MAAGAELTLERVLRDIRAGKPVPVYLLHGDDAFLVGDALERIVSGLLPPADRELRLFPLDGDSLDVPSLCDTLLTPSLLGGRKVVVVRNLRLLASKVQLPDLLKAVRDGLAREPSGAARRFLQFLSLTPWRLDDLQDDGWRRITDEQWEKATGTGGQDREAWLPAALDGCRRLGLKDAPPEAGAGERLTRLLEQGIPEDVHLILTAEAVDQRKSLFRVLAAKGAVLRFSPAKGEARQKGAFLAATKEMLERSGKTVTAGAWIALGRKTGFDLAGSRSALEKLILFAGDRKTIDAADVEEIVGKTKEDTMFDLAAALGERRLGPALTVLKDLFAHGAPAPAVHGMLAREIRFLLHARLLIDAGLVSPPGREMEYARFQQSVYPRIKALQQEVGKEGAGASVLGQHPYVVFQILRNAPRFSRGELAELLFRLEDMDATLKSTSADPQLLCERFLLEACAPPGRKRPPAV